MQKTVENTKPVASASFRAKDADRADVVDRACEILCASLAQQNIDLEKIRTEVNKDQDRFYIKVYEVTDICKYETKIKPIVKTLIERITNG